MQALFDAISRVIRKPTGEKDQATQRFLARCENFRLLLAANNEALKTMAEMTEAAMAGKAFGMSKVRAQCFQVSANVRQMIERLCRMNPGVYDSLRDTFNRIVMGMDTAMAEAEPVQIGQLVIDLEDIRAEHMSVTGSKLALLGEIRFRLDLRVPRGFCITASAYRMFMEYSDLDDEINRLIQIHPGQDLANLRALEESIAHVVALTPLPPELSEALSSTVTTIFKKKNNTKLAMRSSALGEDSKEASFAGQFLSLLGVVPEDVPEAYRSVLASLYSTESMIYRLSRGLREDELVMCVGCMEMIDAKAGGVVYTWDPMGEQGDAVVVSAVPGLPNAIVDGSSQVDTWIIGRRSHKIRRADIATKQWRNVLGPKGGVRRELLPEDTGSAPSISDERVAEIAEAALRIEAYFDQPQDVEWAIGHDDMLYILQCRPLALIREAHETAVAAEDPDVSLALLHDCTPASPGAAAGKPCKVESDEDMLRFQEGNILLVRTAKPKFSALLPKAAALVAEHGSVTGHLANVAREFGIPALIGAPSAVDRLADVPLVTVNAGTGRVYIGRRENQLTRSEPTRSNTLDTAVIRALKRVLPLVTPLHLTDPEAAEFSPGNCTSLHDITRFCHEKGVTEMFRESAVPSASARRLRDEQPLQYWLVDLGGGTVADDSDNHVDIMDIRSNAMKAVWTGMMAVPWEGPPPINAGGFMSIIGEAALNPALAPGMANPMAERNYFIIGRHYCNLQSRFGFHFCTIEGFAGDDPEMNYAFFQFKGGGADCSRRTLRAQLVADILERHGFMAEVRGDSLYARIEGVPAQQVESALSVAGYLMVHTRQIDMVMSNEGSRERYRAKFEKDLRSIIGDQPHMEATATIRQEI